MCIKYVHGTTKSEVLHVRQSSGLYGEVGEVHYPRGSGGMPPENFGKSSLLFKVQ